MEFTSLEISELGAQSAVEIIFRLNRRYMDVGKRTDCGIN